jgi:hypothetical protein
MEERSIIGLHMMAHVVRYLPTTFSVVLRAGKTSSSYEKKKRYFPLRKFSRKKVFVLTFYSLREKCLLGEERQQQQYLE